MAVLIIIIITFLIEMTIHSRNIPVIKGGNNNIVVIQIFIPIIFFILF